MKAFPRSVILSFWFSFISCHAPIDKIMIEHEGEISRLYFEAELRHIVNGRIMEANYWEGRNETVLFWTEMLKGHQNPVEKYSIQSQKKISEPRIVNKNIYLRNQTIQPQKMEKNLRFKTSTRSSQPYLFIVQFRSDYRPEYLELIEQYELEPISYLPEQSYVVRGLNQNIAQLAEESWVRWIGPYYDQYKIDQALQDHIRYRSDSETVEVQILPSKITDQDIVEASLRNQNAKILHIEPWGFIEVEVRKSDIDKILTWPQVYWMEKADRRIIFDMNNARIQGGANHMEFHVARFPHQFTGVGILGHVLEGIDPKHPDFQGNEYRSAPIAIDNDMPSSHGHKTFGIIFGSGQGNENARGVLPNGQGLYTNYAEIYNQDAFHYRKGSRYELTGRLIENHGVMFQSASWGYASTTQYNLRSFEIDRIIFDFDIPITQSQGNTGDQNARPQAWAKNVISVGAVHHFDTADPGDDRWDAGFGMRASIGPALDGRIKPDLVAYFDKTITTQWGGGYTQFGGTSGATPIIAGFLGLILEMWEDGEFREIGSPKTISRPHFTTTKALLIHSAEQYPFSGIGHDMSRFHQGWGFPDLKKLHQSRNQLAVVNESIALSPEQSYEQIFRIPKGQSGLGVTLVYADPPSNIGSSKALINDLDLKVTAPSGEVYWGNFGLIDGMYSLPFGKPDRINTVERVLLQNPEEGRWLISVIAHRLVKDTHLETPELDSDFALVVSSIP